MAAVHTLTFLKTARPGAPATGKERPTALEAADHPIVNLRQALTTSRVIGMALGILMERFTLSEDEAFEYLADASQRRNCKLKDLASDLVYGGLDPYAG